MTPTIGIIIGGLTTTLVILAIALGVVLATQDDDGMPHMRSDGYMGMMQAMGNMDSDGMLAHMREVLGEDAYQRMLDHVAEHRRGGGMAGAGMDDIMHQMMDGMMQQMPADRNNLMPMMPR